MDYYDYNVHNTNSVPGSYIGMDPAYCLWIPPLRSDDPSPCPAGGGNDETIEMSVLDAKNAKCRKNAEISHGNKRDSRLSADSESTLVGDDRVSLKTLQSSPKACFDRAEPARERNRNKVTGYINDSSIRFVDEDDDFKDVSVVYNDNKTVYCGGNNY